MVQGRLVFSWPAVGSAFPKVGHHHEIRLQDRGVGLQYKIENRCCLGIFSKKCQMPLDHPEVQVITDGHLASTHIHESRRDAVEIVDTAKSQIYPLCYTEQIGCSMGVRRLQGL